MQNDQIRVSRQNNPDVFRCIGFTSSHRSSVDFKLMRSALSLYTRVAEARARLNSSTAVAASAKHSVSLVVRAC